jgi:tRNA modification GTPase
MVEKLGVERAWEEIGGADAVVFLHDLTRLDAADYAAADQRIRALLSQRLAANIPIIDVWNKADIAKQATHLDGQSVLLSAKTGAGMAELRAKLLHIAGWQAGAEGTYIARARHVRALDQVGAHLTAAEQHLVQTTQALDLLAEELRLGQNALSDILGEFTSDDLLGVIFSSFCIGK